MSTQWEFAHNLAQASTGGMPLHVPEIRIEHIEQGVYKVSIDKECIHLTARDILDVMDYGLLHARTLEQQAADETPADWKPRKR